jgi:hypothetical protein
LFEKKILLAFDIRRGALRHGDKILVLLKK